MPCCARCHYDLGPPSAITVCPECAWPVSSSTPCLRFIELDRDNVVIAFCCTARSALLRGGFWQQLALVSFRPNRGSVVFVVGAICVSLFAILAPWLVATCLNRELGRAGSRTQIAAGVFAATWVVATLFGLIVCRYVRSCNSGLRCAVYSLAALPICAAAWSACIILIKLENWRPGTNDWWEVVSALADASIRTGWLHAFALASWLVWVWGHYIGELRRKSRADH
jgi:hypothetical protein